ncbi:MAG: phytoene desaturase family protein [Limisphaerales bacterium]
MSAGSYDGIILGTGHNALILQAYLSRCGLKTISLDRAEVPGGGLSTIENPRVPGVFHNPHSFFHRAVTAMPWYRDLELEPQGARYVEPELNVAMIHSDGRSLQWWTDLERTVDSFAAFSKHDAAKLKQWAEEFRPIVENILIPEAQCPPLPAELRRELLERSPDGRRLLEIQELSPIEFVIREFQNDAVRAGLLFFNGLREVDLRLPGFGHAIPSLLASPHKAQMCLGGAAELARALVKDIESHGGAIRCDIELKRIIVESGRASGIELASGERIRSNGFVASGLNPQQTFLQYLPESETSADLRSKAEAFQYNLLAPLFGLHLVTDEPPEYADTQLNHALMTIVGLDSVEQFHQIVTAHEQGKLPPTVAWGSCPTRFDPSQASEGRHTSFLWEKLPYHLNNNPQSWKQKRDQHGARLLEKWTHYAPNLTSDNILDQFCLSPLDTEITLPNMQNGDLLVGSFANDQVGYNRPFPGAGKYRTPIPGLYLCGGSTHPGGNITGLCGYNAARIIATDTDKQVWWNPPDIESHLADR